MNFLGIKINNFFLREKKKRRWKEEEAMMTWSVNVAAKS